jgi:hypothetical protein
VTARLYLWYLDHPRLRRPTLLIATLQALAVLAVGAAPEASYQLTLDGEATALAIRRQSSKCAVELMIPTAVAPRATCFIRCAPR